MIKKEMPVNQTQFSFEEPMFEEQAVYVEEVPKELENKPKSKKRLIIFLAITGIFLIVLALLSLVMMGGKAKNVENIEDSNKVIEKELGPLQQRVEDARDLLNDADPTKQDLSFPPLNMDIRLDKKEK